MANMVGGLPDYLVDPDAVLKDQNVKWRYGRAPDYSKTRKVFAESKSIFSLSPSRDRSIWISKHLYISVHVVLHEGLSETWGREDDRYGDLSDSCRCIQDPFDRALTN